MSAKPNRRETMIQKTRELLVATFPRCFMPAGQPKFPLKIGITKEILQHIPEIGFKNLNEALIDYTAGPTYLASLTLGAPRFDLDGHPSGFVRDIDADHAAERMKGILHWRAKHPLEQAEPEREGE